MLADAAIAPVASMLAHPARVAILLALGDGREIAAQDLALAAGVTPPTASIHLAKLSAAGFIGMRRQGRHCFYRVIRPEVTPAMEALALLAPESKPRTHRQARIGRAVRAARTCYDHLAGQLGVSLTEALVRRGALRPAGRDFEVTAAGAELFGEIGIDLSAARASRRAFAPACLDWSERVPHLAGALGAGLLTVLFDRGWIERMPDSRAVQVTRAGRHAFKQTFGITG